MCSLDSLDHCQTVDTLVIKLGQSWLTVAETCSGNKIKDAMVCSSKSRFGRFLGKILVALKKLFSSKIFPEFRYMLTGTGFMYIIYIWGSMAGF